MFDWVQNVYRLLFNHRVSYWVELVKFCEIKVIIWRKIILLVEVTCNVLSWKLRLIIFKFRERGFHQHRISVILFATEIRKYIENN